MTSIGIPSDLGGPAQSGVDFVSMSAICQALICGELFNLGRRGAEGVGEASASNL